MSDIKLLFERMILRRMPEIELEESIVRKLKLADLALDGKCTQLATIYFDEFLEGYKGEEVVIRKEFPTLLRCSIYLDHFKEFFNMMLEYMYIFEKIETEDALTAMFERFYMYFKYKKPFKINEKKVHQYDKYGRSICFYLAYLCETNITKKTEYIKRAFQSDKNNLSAASIVYANRLTEEYGTLNEVLYAKRSRLEEMRLEEHNREVDIEFTPIGGGDEVGGSCYVLKIANTTMLIDCGVKAEGNTLIKPDLEFLKENYPNVDVILITHAHLDHIGAIEDICNLYPVAPIVMTKETQKLFPINLSRQLPDNMTRIIDNTILLDDCTTLPLPDGIEIEATRAGHILGAASFLITSPKGNIFITGDFCLEAQETLKGLAVPIDLPIDVLITETTYGDTEKVVIHNKCKRAMFGEEMSELINNGNIPLIATASIGREQEILATLIPYAEKNDFRIYVDGQGIVVNKVYEEFTGINFNSPNVHYVRDDLYSSKKDFIHQEVLNNRCCVVASSGMLQEGSCSYLYAKELLEINTGVCVFVGYQAKNTFGDKVKKLVGTEKSQRYIEYDNQVHKVKARILSFDFSSHACIDDIITLALIFNPSRIIAVHGDSREKEPIINKLLARKFNTIQSYNKQTIKISIKGDK